MYFWILDTPIVNGEKWLVLATFKTLGEEKPDQSMYSKICFSGILEMYYFPLISLLMFVENRTWTSPSSQGHCVQPKTSPHAEILLMTLTEYPSLQWFTYLSQTQSREINWWSWPWPEKPPYICFSGTDWNTALCVPPNPQVFGHEPFTDPRGLYHRGPASLQPAGRPVSGPKETVPALPGPHAVYWWRCQNGDSWMPVPVQAPALELQHCGQLLCFWTCHANR